ncbi:hypothetical protein TNCV_674251 [Trichonephila clavipes]|nr:hypothetical protein TNCV_674251 [Trichonephila clavipes]
MLFTVASDPRLEMMFNWDVTAERNELLDDIKDESYNSSLTGCIGDIRKLKSESYAPSKEQLAFYVTFSLASKSKHKKTYTELKFTKGTSFFELLDLQNDTERAFEAGVKSVRLL